MSLTHFVGQPILAAAGFQPALSLTTINHPPFERALSKFAHPDAETTPHARRLKGGGSQNWLPHKVLALIALATFSLHAETGYNAWLRYAPLDEPALTQSRQATPAAIVSLNSTGPEASARDEA